MVKKMSAYEKRVMALENEGMTTSDAQGVVDVQDRFKAKEVLGGISQETARELLQLCKSTLAAFKCKSAREDMKYKALCHWARKSELAITKAELELKG